MIQKARKEEPLILAYMDSLAWVFYKQGRFRQAAKMFEQIIPRSKEEQAEHAVQEQMQQEARERIAALQAARAAARARARDGLDDDDSEMEVEYRH